MKEISPGSEKLSANADTCTDIYDVLTDAQIDHVERMIDILDQHPAVLDTSTMGLGKTRSAIAAALTLGLDILLICERQVQESWIDDCNQFGVNIEVLTFEKLRGVRSNSGNTTLRHDHLIRTDASKKAETTYSTTSSFQKLVAKGILLVLDEAHRAKNEESLTFRACRALVDEVVSQARQGFNSRVALTTATPMCKVEHTFYILCFLGIVSSNSFFEERPGRPLQMTGFQELQKWCEIYGPIDFKDRRRLLTVKPAKNLIPSTAHKMYSEAVRPILLDSIQSSLPFTPEIRNAFIRLTSEEMVKFSGAMTQFKRPTAKTNGKGGLGQIGRVLEDLETLKAHGVARYARSLLETFPTCKVIIYCRYIQPQKIMFRDLSEDFGCVLVNGQVTDDAERADCKARFQEFNPNTRVFIGNIGMSVGTSVDDRHGNFERWTLIYPNYNSIHGLQAEYRACRITTKSQPYVRYMYIAGCPEVRLMKALREKRSVMNSAVMQIKEEEEEYPDDYDSEVYSGSEIDTLQKIIKVQKTS